MNNLVEHRANESLIVGNKGNRKNRARVVVQVADFRHTEIVSASQAISDLRNRPAFFFEAS